MIEYRQAVIEDAELLVNIYNASFYDDYVRYGSCPGYGQTKEMMEESIGKYLKHIILCDKEPVGCVSCIKLENNQIIDEPAFCAGSNCLLEYTLKKQFNIFQIFYLFHRTMIFLHQRNIFIILSI